MSDGNITTTTASTAEIGRADQDLVNRRKGFNYKKCAIFGVAAAILIAIIVVLVVLLTGNDSTTDESVEEFPLDYFTTGRFAASRFNGTWIGNNELLYRSNTGDLILHDVATDTKSRIVPANIEIYQHAESYELSPNKDYLLISYNTQRVFRHSHLAKYVALRLDNMAETNIAIPTSGSEDGLHHHIVKWVPAGNGLVIVHQQNVYYKPTVEADPIQLTTDGSNDIFNGVPDWVYEEEVFASNSALWFSPDGKRLAYMRFDDSNTKRITFPYYGVPGALEFQYPRNIAFNYPKAGTPNPIVSLFEINLETVTSENVERTPIPVPNGLITEEYIISTVSWANNNSLVSFWMNRIQNRGYLQSCTAGDCSILTELESKTGWLDIFTAPHYNSDGTKLAFIYSHDQGSDNGDFRHITILDVNNNNEMYPITSGLFTVVSILKWDTKTNTIFYMGTFANDSISYQLYAVTAEKNKIPQCLTCDLLFDGVKQSCFDVHFSNDNHVMITSIGPDIPRSNLYQWESTADGIKVNLKSEWVPNKELAQKIAETKWPTVIFDEIPIEGTNFTARVMMQLPTSIKIGETTKKYPMLLDVYGGPDTNAVTDRWGVEWGTFMTLNRSVIYTRVDGRGSGVRGDKLLHQMYKSLGTVEIEDQISVAKALQKKYEFIDANHTGIWGWSYGGYASAMALAKDTEGVFRCAASVAPVTDWLYYDSIYTERYLRLPLAEDNLEGYIRSRLSTLYEGFRNKKYFLIHGTLDDNVHYQQAMVLARTLEQHDILFKQQSYTDESHGLESVRPHLYHSLNKFFDDCFDIKSN